jgi:acyl carrier protein
VEFERRLADLIKAEAVQAGAVPPTDLRRESMLADTGLDSLGFANLMVTMQQEFGLDPFGGSDEITYPETFGELLDLYDEEARATGD